MRASFIIINAFKQISKEIMIIPVDKYLLFIQYLFKIPLRGKLIISAILSHSITINFLSQNKSMAENAFFNLKIRFTIPELSNLYSVYKIIFTVSHKHLEI